ncbi:4Fe-4S binding protein [Ruminococcaceae bacterium OttesenSCG-928-L11]|nr:4Fe-4S binding protein [Ruminococcaceae bacterium OttesenSCG-928-L11]
MANKVTVNAEVCKGCGLCVHACPKKIMKIDRSRLNSKGYNPAMCEDPDTCIACAMCGIMCPDSTITVEKEDK